VWTTSKDSRLSRADSERSADRSLRGAIGAQLGNDDHLKPPGPGLRQQAGTAARGVVARAGDDRRLELVAVKRQRATQGEDPGADLQPGDQRRYAQRAVAAHR
jgi:hypothetical protein